MKRLILILALVLLPQMVWGGNKYSKTITISGTGAVETDYIVRLNLHYGSHDGDVTTEDIFLDGKSRTDFADVRFSMNGAPIGYYRHSYGNYEIIPDSTLKQQTIILPDGKLLGTGGVGTGQGIWLSADNGATWSNVYSTTEAFVAFVDSVGNAFAYTSRSTSTGTYRMIRSAGTDTDRTTWTEVLNMSAVSGIGTITSIAEDASGNLYFGRYQDSTATQIYKSTDRGVNWTSSYSSASYQHCHGVYVDTTVTPNAIYVGVDGNPSGILKSTNAGSSWSALTGVPANAAFNGMVAITGKRFFSGEASVYGGPTIFSTTDDSSFTSDVTTGQLISGMQKLGSTMYAFGGTNGINKHAQVYRSADNGATWETVLIDNYHSSTTTSAGWRFVSNVGVPAGQSESQFLVGGLDTGSSTRFRNIRVFDGGNHHQGLFFVKIPVLPATGATIKITYGDTTAATTSTKTIFTPTQQSGLVARWSFNEGTGTAVADNSGGGRNGVLTPGTGSWISEGRRAGALYPQVSQAGSSFRFAGDGYVDIAGSNTDPGLQFVKNFTYLAWVRTTDNSLTLRQIVGKNGLSSPTPIGLYVRTASTLAFYYGNGSGYTNVNTNGTGLLWRNLFDGGWHLVAVTISNDATPTATFSIDDQSGTPVALSYTPSNSPSGKYRIGANIDNNQYFIGDIDDVQIYNRALTATEIRQIYESRMFATTEPGVAGIGGLLRLIGGGGNLNLNFQLGY